MTAHDPNPAIKASTIVLFRQCDTGPAEHLMIERAASMAFAAGALVFPGGRIDPDDYAIAQNDALLRHAPPEAEERAARIAAIREAIEETGTAIGVDADLSDDTIREWRTALKAQQPFSAMLADITCTLDLSRLVPFARWCPNLGEHRRFDTRFYIARIAQGELREIEVDTDEASRHRWLTARQAIDGAAAGDHRIIFPTMRNLERLAAYPRFNDALAHLATVRQQTISPQIRDADGEQWLCIPDDAGYPVTRARLADVMAP